jgi:hypothetical protein
MKIIQLSKGAVTLVDDSNFESLRHFKWHLTNTGRAGRIARIDGKKCTILMHRQILNAQPGEQVDHKNMDPLDNRRDNLRLASFCENQWNRCRYSNNSTGAKGVDFRGNRFRVRIQVHGKSISLGTFVSLELAQQAYAKAASKYHGEFARAM